MAEQVETWVKQVMVRKAVGGNINFTDHLSYFGFFNIQVTVNKSSLFDKQFTFPPQAVVHSKNLK